MMTTKIFPLILILCIIAIVSNVYANKTEQIEYSEKFQELKRLQSEDPLIDLTGQNELLTQLVLSGPRDYSVIFLLTSLSEKLPCPVCATFDSMFSDVARGFAGTENRPESVFFVRFDASSMSKETLALVTKSVHHLPHLVKLSPTTSPKIQFNWGSSEIYQIQPSKISVHHFALWVKSQTGVFVHIINHQRIISVILGIIITATVAWINRTWIYKQLSNPMVYFAISFLGYCIVMSGSVYTFIHKTPFIAFDRSGNLHWLIPSPREQLGAEGLVMATIVSIAGFCWIILADLLPSSQRPKSLALVILLMCCAIMWLGRNLFKRKNPYYPY